MIIHSNFTYYWLAIIIAILNLKTNTKTRNIQVKIYASLTIARIMHALQYLNNTISNSILILIGKVV